MERSLAQLNLPIKIERSSERLTSLGGLVVLEELARGEMENRIKEQLMLFADRTSTAYLRSNQIRLYYSSVAYVLMEALRRLGLKQTELVKAKASTIRLKVLKIGALIRITVRKVWCRWPEAILIVSCSPRSMPSCAPRRCGAEK